MEGIINSERGQLFLVGAIALALAFVGLAFLLNSAIFTENLASQGTDTGEIDASKITYAATKNTEDIIYSTNNATNYTDDDAADYDALKKEFNQQSYVANPTVQSASIEQGAAVDVRYRPPKEGVRLTQDRSRPLTDRTDTPGTWFILNPYSTTTATISPTNTYQQDDLRAFQMTLGDSPIDEDATITVFRFNATPPLTLASPEPTLINDDRGREIDIKTDDTDGDGNDEVSVNFDVDVDRDGSVDRSVTCEAPISEGERVTINFMSGTVGGNDCDELQLIWDGANSDINSYAIRVENGERLTNTQWQIVLNQTDYASAGSPYAQSRDGTDSGQPYIQDGDATGDKELGAIWSVEQRISYATQDEEYTRTTNVTPHPIRRK